MELPRQGRKWLDLDIELEDAAGNPVTPTVVELTIDAGLTWHAADTSASTFRWLLDGPAYNPLATGMPTAPVGVTTIPVAAACTYSVRAVASPEVEIASGKIYLTD